MKIYQKVVVAAIPVFALCNCASIVSKSDYPVTITSSTPKKVTIQNRVTGRTIHSGTTPTTITLAASEGYFQPAKYDIVSTAGTRNLNASLDPWYAGNLLFGGIIGVFIDPATGAMWKLPKEVYLNE